MFSRVVGQDRSIEVGEGYGKLFRVPRPVKRESAEGVAGEVSDLARLAGHSGTGHEVVPIRFSERRRADRNDVLCVLEIWRDQISQ